jgi:tetratricopeptide (TPR) repeat protein
LKRGNLAAAREGFLGEREAHERLSALLPNDSDLQVSISNVDSYLGTLAERTGDLAEAAARFGAQVARLESVAKADPLSARMKQRLAVALGLQADALNVLGRHTEAQEARRQALGILDALIALDAANLDWKVEAFGARLKLAMQLKSAGETAEAGRLVRESCAAVEALARNASPKRAVIVALALAWRLEAQRREAAGDPAVGEAVAKALAASQKLLALDRGDEPNLFVYATTCVVAGELAQRAGDFGKARENWEAALQALRERLAGSTHWRILDPAVRALAHLDRVDEAQGLVGRLERAGYHFLEPWPKPLQSVLSATSNR